MGRVIVVVLALAVFAHCLSAQTWTVLSAARLDRSALVAPDSIATGFNASIRAATPQTAEPSLPLTLAGYSVAVRDSLGTESAAPILSVADGQINFIVPASAALGEATFALSNEGRAIASTIVRIARIAPGLFTANASGSGAPAGLALTVAADGSRTTTELVQSATGGGFLPRPLTLSGQVYLVLFGTGIRGSGGEVTATIGGNPVAVAAAVAQGIFAGLDQVNLGPIITDFPDRRGELDLILTVDGVPANRVTVAFNPPALGQWGERARLIEANSEMAVAEVDGKILVLGGYPSSRETKSTVQRYDPGGDRWELTTPMPVGLNHNMAATVNGKLYMIGGQLTDAGAGNFSDRVFEFDPSTRQWRERARMPAARGAGVAVVADSKIYVAGGRPPRGSDFAVYDPQADTWRTLPDMPTARNHLAGAELDGKVYIVGGRFEAGFQSPQSAVVEVFDPATNSWSTRAPMPKARGGINGVAANGCLHVFGGEGNASAVNGLHFDHDAYNPVLNTWTSLAPMPVPVHGVTGAVFLNGLIYLPGGGTSQGGSSGGLQHQVYRPDMICK